MNRQAPSAKRVVLATAPGGFISKEYVPLVGLGYLAASLEKRRYESSILDSHALGISIEEAVRRIAEAKANAVGITATTHNRFEAIELATVIKRELGLFVVVGGPHFSMTAEDALRHVPAIDVVVQGEGENALPDLLDAHFSGQELLSVPGISFRDSRGSISHTPARPLNLDLDSLPWPSWHLFSLDSYTGTLEGEFETRAVGVISSRGCPNNCTFCANAALGQRLLRRRNPEDFVNEVELLHKDFGVNAFDFWDDTITMVRPHVEAICRELINRKLDIIWYATSRVNTVDERLLALMREAGCVAIGFGVESGSDRILRVIKKGITVAQARQAVRTASGLGFRTVKAFFMFNHPEETRKEIIQTLDLMDEMEGYGPNVVVPFGLTRIYPGTGLEGLAKAQGLLSPDFSWNTYHRFDQGAVAIGDPTIPLYESCNLPFDEVKAMVLRRRSGQRNLSESAVAGLRKLSRVHTVSDLTALAREGIAYFRERTRR